jgi:hypothetical protein
LLRTCNNFKFSLGWFTRNERSSTLEKGSSARGVKAHVLQSSPSIFMGLVPCFNLLFLFYGLEEYPTKKWTMTFGFPTHTPKEK